MRKYLLLISVFIFGSSLFIVCDAQINNIHDFDDTGTNGAYGSGNLTLVGNKLYGMTAFGGTKQQGNIFRINTDGSGYKDLWNFDMGGDTNGSEPYGSLLLVGNKFYGMTQIGGINKNGNIFRIDTNGSGYKDLWDFDGGGDSNGSQPYSNVILFNSKLYGMTLSGGINSSGNIFRIDTNGSSYKDLWDFDIGGDTNGSVPYGDVTVLGGKLYGMTQNGGINIFGNIFRIDTNGSGYKDLWNFDIGGDTNGSRPDGDLIRVGDKWYGMTSYGGINSYGNVFRIDTNGSGYKDRWDFDDTGTNGSTPVASLIVSGNTLYGMSEYGGTYTFGVIFSLDTNGSQYTDMFNFNNVADGAIPMGNLTLSGGVLYGMALEGGANDFGIIFNNNLCSLSGVTTGDTGVLCHGENNGIAYITNIAGGAGPYTYLWAPGGQTNASINGLSAGTYTLTLNDHNGCSVSSAVTITEPVALSMPIHFIPNTNIICNGSAWVTVSGGTLPYTYFWTPGGNTTDSISHECRGTYCCTVTDANGCTSSVCVDITSTVGIDELKGESEKIKVYPNPSSGAFTLRVESERLKVESFTVEIYNVLGEKMYSQFLIPNSQFLINLSSQPSGIYFYRIIAESGGLVGEGKLIIQK